MPGGEDGHHQVGGVPVDLLDQLGQHHLDRRPVHEPSHRPLARSCEKWKPSYTDVIDRRLRNTKFPTADGPPPSIGMQSTILLSTPYGESAAAQASASVSCPAPNLPERKRARRTVTSPPDQLVERERGQTLPVEILGDRAESVSGAPR